jgi:hypothetical protein
MTTAEPTSVQLTDQQLGTIFQYTVEAYKTFEKLAENLPNPMSASAFKKFAKDEREVRDLLEIKYAGSRTSRVRVTLGADLLFQDMLEGDLSYREMTEFLIARERTMEKKLVEFSRVAGSSDRNLLIYLAASKRSHVVQLERELEMIRIYPDWYRREDGESLIVHGAAGA